MIDEQLDVDLLVVGGGVAGATAAITAADLGASVVLVEKLPRLGGTCPYSAGNLVEYGGAQALDRLLAMSFGTTSRDVLQSYLAGLDDVRDWLHRLGASTQDADPAVLPNCWPNFPGADGVRYYSVAGAGGGAALWSVIESALRSRDVRILVDTPMVGLRQDDGRITGADVRLPDGSLVTVDARHGVILATGGMENDSDLAGAYLPVPGVVPVGNPGNTGDGLRAAQAAGAALWHMSTFYGFWAFRAPSWSTGFPLLFFAPEHAIVDGRGRRFVAETGREPHDAMRRVGDVLPTGGSTPSLPGWVVFDDALLTAGPLCRFPSATGYQWSPDNSAELRAGWIVEADSVAALADRLGIEREQLVTTVERFNAAAERGVDEEFGRPAETMRPLVGPTYYALPIRPGVATASGGPRRDSRARVLAHGGEVIPGLFAAGGNGGIWGQLTEHGGGLTDGLVFGAIAANTALDQARTSSNKER